MKILFVIDIYDTCNNGTSISAQRFAAELTRMGHCVKILCADHNQAEDKFLVSEIRVPLFQHLVDGQGMILANPYKHKQTIIQAIEWADIIHYYMPFALSIYTANLATKAGKPQTAAFHIQPENIWSSVNLGKMKWLQDRSYHEVYRLFYKHFRHIHVPSKFMGEMLVKQDYKAKIHIISNGIHQDFLKAGQQFIDNGRPAKTPNLVGKILITMVGRLSTEKRQDVLINAVKYSKYADQIQLAFAGHGPKYNDYITLSKKLKNKPMFLYLTKEELIRHLGMTDLYVHTSDMESEAISCIEAFATGLVPVIANSDVSATPQFAIDGRSLFKPGHPQDLARAIDYWLDHKNERHYMGKLYYQSATNYTLDNSVRRFEQMLLEEIADNEKQ